MTTLVKQLDEKSRDILKHFQDHHPINHVVGQHSNSENKRVMHRIFRVMEEFGPKWSAFCSKVLEFNITDEEKEVFRSLEEYFSKESIANVLAEYFNPFFGEISPEVRAEKSWHLWPQMTAFMDRVLARKDGLHCLVMFYAVNQIWDTFRKSFNEEFSKSFLGSQMNYLNIIRKTIENHPKAQKLNERSFGDYVNTYVEFLELDLKAYNYFYDLSYHVIMV